MTIRVKTMLIALTIGHISAACAFDRSGPAAGGGLEPYVPPAIGTSLTSSEFRKLDCSPGETRIGRESYYTCGGQTYKKDMLCGRRVYVVVSGVPY